jgi:hypothetical protein
MSSPRSDRIHDVRFVSCRPAQRGSPISGGKIYAISMLSGIGAANQRPFILIVFKGKTTIGVFVGAF